LNRKNGSGAFLGSRGLDRASMILLGSESLKSPSGK